MLVIEGGEFTIDVVGGGGFSEGVRFPLSKKETINKLRRTKKFLRTSGSSSTTRAPGRNLIRKRRNFNSIDILGTGRVRICDWQLPKLPDMEVVAIRIRKPCLAMLLEDMGERRELRVEDEIATYRHVPDNGWRRDQLREGVTGSCDSSCEGGGKVGAGGMRHKYDFEGPSRISSSVGEGSRD